MNYQHRNHGMALNPGGNMESVDNFLPVLVTYQQQINIKNLLDT